MTKFQLRPGKSVYPLKMTKYCYPPCDISLWLIISCYLNLDPTDKSFSFQLYFLTYLHDVYI